MAGPQFPVNPYHSPARFYGGAVSPSPYARPVNHHKYLPAYPAPQGIHPPMDQRNITPHSAVPYMGMHDPMKAASVQRHNTHQHRAELGMYAGLLNGANTFQHCTFNVNTGSGTITPNIQMYQVPPRGGQPAPVPFQSIAPMLTSLPTAYARAQPFCQSLLQSAMTRINYCNQELMALNAMLASMGAAQNMPPQPHFGAGYFVPVNHMVGHCHALSQVAMGGTVPAIPPVQLYAPNEPLPAMSGPLGGYYCQIPNDMPFQQNYAPAASSIGMGDFFLPAGMEAMQIVDPQSMYLGTGHGQTEQEQDREAVKDHIANMMIKATAVYKPNSDGSMPAVDVDRWTNPDFKQQLATAVDIFLRAGGNEEALRQYGLDAEGINKLLPSSSLYQGNPQTAPPKNTVAKVAKKPEKHNDETKPSDNNMKQHHYMMEERRSKTLELIKDTKDTEKKFSHIKQFLIDGGDISYVTGFETLEEKNEMADWLCETCSDHEWGRIAAGLIENKCYDYAYFFLCTDRDGDEVYFPRIEEDLRDIPDKNKRLEKECDYIDRLIRAIPPTHENKKVYQLMDVYNAKIKSLADSAREDKRVDNKRPEKPNDLKPISRPKGSSKSQLLAPKVIAEHLNKGTKPDKSPKGDGKPLIDIDD